MEGMNPENMLPTSSRFVNLLKFTMNAGIEPVSLFLYKEMKTRFKLSHFFKVWIQKIVSVES